MITVESQGIRRRKDKTNLKDILPFPSSNFIAAEKKGLYSEQTTPYANRLFFLLEQQHPHGLLKIARPHPAQIEAGGDRLSGIILTVPYD